MNTFTFDIETIPDIAYGRKQLNLGALDDKGVAQAMLALRRQESGGSEFLPHYLHRIVAISGVLRTHDKLKIWSLGDPNASEKELLQRFFDGIERLTPTLVSWNGGGFDLPVIHYRALYQGVCAAKYWEVGEFEQSFRWNNYLNRFHYRHLDLMDILAGYQMRANAPLDKLASMLGFPGKMGMDGSQVLDYYLAGDIVSIRNYCETDVLNTYLIYLRFELMRGRLTQADYTQECDLVRQALQQEDKNHFKEFLEKWSN